MTQNIYQQLGLKQVINACGKMTILGVSSVAPEVMQATARAASSFVEIDQLVDKTGELVSRFTGAEDSYVTSCASAGIAIAVAYDAANFLWNAADPDDQSQLENLWSGFVIDGNAPPFIRYDQHTFFLAFQPASGARHVANHASPA